MKHEVGEEVERKYKKQTDNQSIRVAANFMETKVLLIEDEADLCMVLKKLLEREHFVVECAHTIVDGIGKIKTFEPAIVFLDYTLPDGSGVSVIPVLKQLRPQARLVMISAMDQVMTEALDQGADTFIRKPFRFENVLDFVTSCRTYRQ